MNGYSDPSYAYSLVDFGQPRELRHYRGWILERQINSSGGHNGH